MKVEAYSHNGLQLSSSGVPLAENRVPLVKERAKQGLKEVVHNCQDLSALEPLVDAATPAEVLRHVLSVFAEGVCLVFGLPVGHWLVVVNRCHVFGS